MFWGNRFESEQRDSIIHEDRSVAGDQSHIVGLDSNGSCSSIVEAVRDGEPHPATSEAQCLVVGGIWRNGHSCY